MKRLLYTTTLIALCSISVFANRYEGRVVDEKGEGIGYATVYPESNPVIGVATNNDGYFCIETDELPEYSTIVISFIGYEKQSMPLSLFLTKTSTNTPDSLDILHPTSTPAPKYSENIATIVLHEQPIALEEMVVAAKPAKQRNKRKQMANLLHTVYVQMEKDFGNAPTRYHVVSDVRMDSEEEAWGMEQMIASVVVLPEGRKDNRDSIQFSGEYCKRFFDSDIRTLADTILAGDGLERIHKNVRKAALAVDSGVLVHESLFSLGNTRYEFEKWSEDVRNWSVSNESEGEVVLTHTEKHNYMGIVKYSITRNYILDSKTYSIKRLSEYGEGAINIPFGIKLNHDQLQLLNLFNMDEKKIEKFRLRKMNAKVHFNTIYRRHNGHIYILEKNLHANAYIIGTKKMEIPVDVSATQRVINLQTDNVKPMSRQQINRRVKRQIVEIY